MKTLAERVVDEILSQLAYEACFTLDSVPEGDKIYGILVRQAGAILTTAAKELHNGPSQQAPSGARL